MSFLKKKESTQDITPVEIKNTRKWLDQLLKLYKPGESPNFPTQGVAGMGENETAMQQILQQYLSGGNEGQNLAMGQAKKTLAGDYDPRTSQFYQGFRDEQQALKDQSGAQIRRQAQKAGEGRATPVQGIQAQNSQAYDSKIMQMLGSLYQGERQMQEQAGRDAGNIGQQQFGNLLNSQNLAAVPRSISQAKEDATYTKLINELLFPYREQLAVASTLFKTPANTYRTTGGGNKGWVDDVSGGIAMAGGIAGLGGFSGALGGMFPQKP